MRNIAEQWSAGMKDSEKFYDRTHDAFLHALDNLVYLSCMLEQCLDGINEYIEEDFFYPDHDGWPDAIKKIHELSARHVVGYNGLAEVHSDMCQIVDLAKKVVKE